MSLDDREQQILAEIERQFYADDPDLVNAVKNIDRFGRFGVRLPLVGLMAGMAILLATFTANQFVAVVGFGLMAISATALVHGIRSRGGLRTDDGAEQDGGRRGPVRRPRRGR
jgi:hypothetical protein